MPPSLIKAVVAITYGQLFHHIIFSVHGILLIRCGPPHIMVAETTVHIVFVYLISAIFPYFPLFGYSFAFDVIVVGRINRISSVKKKVRLMLFDFFQTFFKPTGSVM